jgi:hypothetical protein
MNAPWFVDAEDYKASEQFVRSLDKVDGGLNGTPPAQQIQCILIALESGLRKSGIKNNPKETNSAFDALVMLHDYYDQLLAVD